MSELCWTSMTDLARMIASKKVSPVEVVQAHLDRIAALDGKLKSYITVMGDSALAGAKAAEAAVMSGRLAAHAVAGAPRLEDIVGFDHP